MGAPIDIPHYMDKQNGIDSSELLAKVKEYESRNKGGGIKNDSLKPRMSLVPQLAKYIIGKVSTYGEEKYDSFNWMNGFKWTILADAIDRHYIPYMCGEDNDPESGLPHLAHLAWNAMAALENCYLHPELDDRAPIYKTERGKAALKAALTPFIKSPYLLEVLEKKKKNERNLETKEKENK